MPNNQVNITITGASPIDGSYVATTTVFPTQLKIEKQVSVGGSGGTVSFVNAFVVGGSSSATATNLQGAITSALSSSNITAIVVSPIGVDPYVVITYKDITASFISQPATLALPAIAVDAFSVESLIGFKTQENYTDLFAVGDLVDFLQTKPGHRTYAYDIVVKQIGSRVEGTTTVP